jgi:hypothetical protein
MIVITKLYDGIQVYFKGYSDEGGELSFVPYWTNTKEDAIHYEDISDAEKQLEELDDEFANIEII